MKLPVVFVNDANLVRLQDPKAKLPTKSLRYEIPKNTDLSLHVLNLHKSLNSLGLSFLDGPPLFTLRLQTIATPSLPSYPKYLKSCGPEIDQQLIELLSELPKTHKKKGLQLEFVIAPNILAQRFIDVIQQTEKLSAVKETAFHLVTQLKIPEFADEFTSAGGIKALIGLFDIAKGNTVAYTINAIGATLQGNEYALDDLIRNNGVGKLLSIIECPSLSVVRRGMEVLHHVCESGNESELYDKASRDNHKGLKAIFNQLESEDLHTRVAALRIVNLLLESALKEAIMEEIESNSVILVLQNSLSVTTPEIIVGLRQFEKNTGKKLTGGNDTMKLKDRVKELEKEIKFLKEEKELKNSISDDILSEEADKPEGEVRFALSALENEIGRLSFGAIDFGEELDPSEDSSTETTSSDKSRFSVALERSSLSDSGKSPLKIEALKQEALDTQARFDEYKNQVDTERANELKTLQEELRLVREENENYKSKIQSLSETVQQLIKSNDTGNFMLSPRLFHMDSANKVRDSTIITPLSTPKRDEKELNITSSSSKISTQDLDKLKQEKTELEESIEELQRRKYEVDSDKYQLLLDVDRLKNEYTAMEDKKEKLSTVIETLQKKKNVLIQECERSKTTLTRIKEDIANQTASDEEINDKISNCNDASSSEDKEKKMKRMEDLVESLITQKRSLKTQIEQLEKQLSEQSEF